MFSSLYPSASREVAGFASSEFQLSSATEKKLSRADPSIARVLWNPEFGRCTTVDRTILASAIVTKRGLFEDRIFGVVPIYVTSICHERCLYCNFRADNKGVELERVRLSEGEIKREARYLVAEKGLRALELVYATDPLVRVDAMCRHVELLQRLLQRHGGGCVGINAEALDEDEYRRLVDAGLSFAVLWQETYDRERYRQLHPGRTKKTDFEYRLDAYERMIRGGLRHVGMGVLSGLADWRTDWAMLMQHEAYLQSVYGCEAAILGIPRLKPARGAIVQTSPWVPNREEFRVAVALHNIFSPRTLPFVNTREDLELCIDLSRGGGSLFTFNCSTIPGGYSLGHRGYQFPTASYDAPTFAPRLLNVGLTPVFDWSFEEAKPRWESAAVAEQYA